jgi:hypothetical protein
MNWHIAQALPNRKKSKPQFDLSTGSSKTDRVLPAILVLRHGMQSLGNTTSGPVRRNAKGATFYTSVSGELKGSI